MCSLESLDCRAQLECSSEGVVPIGQVETDDVVIGSHSNRFLRGLCCLCCVVCACACACVCVNKNNEQVIENCLPFSTSCFFARAEDKVTVTYTQRREHMDRICKDLGEKRRLVIFYVFFTRGKRGNGAYAEKTKIRPT